MIADRSMIINFYREEFLQVIIQKYFDQIYIILELIFLLDLSLWFTLKSSTWNSIRY